MLRTIGAMSGPDLVRLLVFWALVVAPWML